MAREHQNFSGGESKNGRFTIIKRPEDPSLVKIRIVGVGGGGGNALNHMVEGAISNVEFIAVNTDAQVLDLSQAEKRLHIGSKLTGGRGAGGKPEIGKKAAEESKGEIEKELEGSNMVFITAGMGGGTGTGAAPVVAQISKELGILTVAVVTTPFNFEGRVRMEQADEGIKELRQHVDALMVIPNEQLKALKRESGEPITFHNAFKAADDVLYNGVKNICDLIQQNGNINLDFNDVSSVLKSAGDAHMGVSEAESGKDMAKVLVEEACNSTLMMTSIKGARRLLANLVTSQDALLEDVEEIMTHIHEQASPNASIFFGHTYCDDFGKKIRLTVIAAGFEDDEVIDFELPSTTFNKMAAAKAQEKRQDAAVPTPPAATAGRPSARSANPALAPQESGAGLSTSEDDGQKGFFHEELFDDALAHFFRGRMKDGDHHP